MLQVGLHIQKFSFRQIIHNPSCHLPLHKIYQEQRRGLTLILILNVTGDYKNIELVLNKNSVALDVSNVLFRVLEFLGLKLHNQTIFMT
jgi:hypothetical protein